MAASGITRIDKVLDGTDPTPIGHTDDVQTVGAVQDLLGGHGFMRMPRRDEPAYGQFGVATAQAIVDFQTQRGLPHAAATETPAGTGKKKQRATPMPKPEAVTVDRATLDRLLEPPVDEPQFRREAFPRVSRVYATQRLGEPWGMLLQCTVFTCLFEGRGRFYFPNRNTDKQGLSIGVIHWAQGQGRLTELIQELTAADEPALKLLMGGDAQYKALRDHLKARPFGIDANGVTTNPKVDLIHPTWLRRFRLVCLREPFQRVQVKKAIADYRTDHPILKAAVAKPEGGFYLHSERAMSFFLDLANQFGKGAPGGEKGAIPIFETVLSAGPTDQKSLLQRMTIESVRRAKGEKLKVSTQTRRDFFCNTTFLRDDVDFVAS